MGWIESWVTSGGDTGPSNRITLLRDADGDGVAETSSVFIEGLNSPFGMTLVGDDFYVADSDAITRIGDAAGIRGGDLIYEVGAGRGRLTTELLRRGARVVAYESDHDMAARLPRHDRLSVRAEDFLAAVPPRREFAVVGNIPYGLTAAVIDWCLRAGTLRSATLLTQLEYAQIAELSGWSGARICQDNVIWKPAGAKALGYHQDDSYAKWFTPSHMATCWIALDDTSAVGGTIEYARGSHRWGQFPPLGEEKP